MELTVLSAKLCRGRGSAELHCNEKIQCASLAVEIDLQVPKLAGAGSAA